MRIGIAGPCNFDGCVSQAGRMAKDTQPLPGCVFIRFTGAFGRGVGRGQRKGRFLWDDNKECARGRGT